MQDEHEDQHMAGQRVGAVSHDGGRNVHSAAAAARKDAMSLRADYARRRIASLLVGLVTLFIMGLIFAWSIFTTPIAADTGWDTALLAQNFRVVMICQAIGCIVSSLIQRRCNGEPRLALIVGGVMVVLGFALCGVCSGWGVASVFVFYGGVAAMGAGISFNAILTTVNLWFPDRVGFISGLQMFSFGVASLVFGVMMDNLMNTIGWRATLLGLGVIVCVLNVAAAMVIKAPPVDIDEVFPSKSASSAAQGAAAPDMSKNPHFKTDFCVSKKQFTTAQMMKTPVFWIGLVWFICTASIGLTLLGESRQDALSLGTEATLATLLVGILSLANGGMSIVYGLLLDRFGLINHMRLMSGVSVVGICIVTAAFAAQSSPMFIAGALIVSAGYGGLPVFSTTFTLNRYGRLHYSANCAIGTAFLVPASLASMILAPAFRGTGGLGDMYAGFVAVMAVALVALLVFVRRYRKEMSQLV